MYDEMSYEMRMLFAKITQCSYLYGKRNPIVIEFEAAINLAHRYQQDPAKWVEPLRVECTEHAEIDDCYGI